MSHDAKTSRDFYQATVGDRDAAVVYNTIRKLRIGGGPSGIDEPGTPGIRLLRLQGIEYA